MVRHTKQVNLILETVVHVLLPTSIQRLCSFNYEILTLSMNLVVFIRLNFV